MVEWPTTEIKTLAHNPTQWLAGVTLASLAHHSTHYTPDATPEDLADNDVLQSYSYDYYKDGQKSKETFVDKDGQTHTWAWVYDQLSRLISEVHDNADNKQDYTTDYTYDLVGNRLNTEVDKNNDGTIDTQTNSTFDVNDRLLSETKLVDGAKNQRTDYLYNKTEQISKVVTDLINSQVETKTTMAYNAQGRLSEITIETYTNGVKSNIVTQEYTYDSSGMKVRQVENIDANADGKIDAESSTFYLLDALNHTGYTQVLEERRVENGVEVKVTTYTIGHDVLSQFDSANGYLVLLSDGHGSTRAVANMAGEIVQEYNYDAYGNAHGFDAEQALTNLLYSGEQFNPVSGLQYLRARWYDPGSGRFNRLDPYFGDTSSPLSFHKYAYGHMNPVGNADPTGMFLSIIDIAMSMMDQMPSRSSGMAANAPMAKFAGSSAQSFRAAIQVLRTISQQRMKQGLKNTTRAIDKAVKKELKDLKNEFKDFKTNLKNMHVFPVIEPLYENVYEHHTRAFDEDKLDQILKYRGPAPGKSGHKRDALNAFPVNDIKWATNIEGPTSRDEYPYASTFEGNKKGEISVMYVTATHNSAHGAQLSGFYRMLGNRPNIIFFVVPVSTEFIMDM